MYHSITAMENARILRAPESIAALDFLRGVAIATDAHSPWVFEIEMAGGQIPHFVGGTIPMASETLLAVLLDAGLDNIQTFPTVLQRRNGDIWKRHSVFNVIGLVDAADPSGGPTDGGDGAVTMEAPTLALSRHATRDLALFRLFHDPATLIVDDRVMRKLNRHRPEEGWGFSAFEIQVIDPTPAAKRGR